MDLAKRASRSDTWRVTRGLRVGADHAVIKALGVAGGLEFFGLQHEVAALVGVNAPGASRAIAVGKGDWALEHVVWLGRGVGFVTKRFAM